MNEIITKYRIFECHYSPVDEKMLIFFSKGMVIYQTIENLKTYRRKNKTELNFNLKCHSINKVQLLKCQNRILLYLKDDKSNSNCEFTNIGIIDLDEIIEGKGMCIAKGYEDDLSLIHI